MPPTIWQKKKESCASFCLPPVCTFYTITCHHLTTLTVLIFTIYIINSKMRLLPFCRQESEIKWQRDMPDLMVFWFQMRRRQHWGNYSPTRQDSTEESICCLTLCQKPNNWYCHIYENSSGLCAWKKEKKKEKKKEITKEVSSVPETWKPEAKASRSSHSQSFQFQQHCPRMQNLPSHMNTIQTSTRTLYIC